LLNRWGCKKVPRRFESCTHRQSEKEVTGSPRQRRDSPAAIAKQSKLLQGRNFLLGAKLNFLSFKIKFEPTFFPVLWQFAFPLPLFGEAGGRGVGRNFARRAR